MDVAVWKNLLSAYQQKSSLPLPPDVDQNIWPPSGMENMDASFKWAIGKTNGVTADSWRFYYGTWLAGRGKADEAVKVLSVTKAGLAKVLLARLLKQKGDMAGARKAFDAILELKQFPNGRNGCPKLMRLRMNGSLKERSSY